jgi:hypothetical protein
MPAAPSRLEVRNDRRALALGAKELPGAVIGRADARVEFHGGSNPAR